LGERTITIDCDVIQADGGTRTASITGGYVALVDACRKLLESGVVAQMPITGYVAATSVGVVNQQELLDLCYIEDSSAEVDMNVIMSDKGEFIELQATGEKCSFSKSQLDNLLLIAQNGIEQLIAIQKEVLGEY